MAAQANGQTVFQDYVLDRYAQYSPFDHQQRGLIYRIHTGHAGIFGNCDDDRAKMVSPYIDWYCRRPDRNLTLHFARELVTDMFRKNQRLTDGAGACVFGRCQDCRQPSADCHCQPGPATRSMISPVPGYGSQARRDPARVGVRQAVPTTGTVMRQRDGVASETRYASIYERESQRLGATGPGRLQRTAGQRAIIDRQVEARTAERDTDSATEYGSLRKSSRSRSSVESSDSLRSVPRESVIDPRIPENGDLLPEDRFKPIEDRVNQSTTSSQRNSDFQLSAGPVYQRPQREVSTQLTPESQSKLHERRIARQLPPRQTEPAGDRRSDPQYFQFRQIGGSKYR